MGVTKIKQYNNLFQPIVYWEKTQGEELYCM
jgi:hypothetical protein